MKAQVQVRYWLIALVLTGGALWLLSDILLPFVAGIAVAYFLDPLADRLEARGVGRTWAALIVLVLFFFLLVLTALLLVPVLQSQILGLVQRLPSAVAGIRESLVPMLSDIAGRIELDLGGAKSALQDVAGNAVEFALSVLKRAWSGGLALFNILSLVLITPVVAFYLLRDFDRLTERVDSWLPRPHAAELRRLFSEINDVLAGFVRGQGSVCMILGLFYGLSLTLVGLDFGLIIGLLSGLISFVPFVGAATGLVLSAITALTQFLPDGDYLHIGAVAVVFVVGQILEGNFLTPRLLGDSIGLHPVWVIFALLAGGSLFGFVGVLMAVPVAASLGVLVRFGVERYLDSRLYHGGGPGDDGQGE